ncbi:hypothetical protein K440DRAFT_638179 [Wilcoxina mikolae CBS 423.85]|nr:hypothetical protein K440DRAFT_638179 [Wilcoxina mikolae CBS 423.85]
MQLVILSKLEDEINLGLPIHEFFDLIIGTRARATSAAPRYFKPFRHDETGRIFADGALCFNNPVEIADNERKLLWPRHARPDVFISVGTGMEQQFGEIAEQISERGGATKWSPLVYLKRLKGIVTHQAEMNMNSQKAWNDFLAKRQLELTSNDLKHRNFRFNVEFPDSVPKLDHVEGLDDLKALALRSCNANSHLIRTAATKQIASLFYLRVNKIFTKEKRAKFQVQVGPDDGKLRGLVSTAPFFVKKGNDPFMLNIEFHVGNIDEPIGIYLGSGYEKETSALISGFPCSLVQLKKLHRCKLDCRSSDTSEFSDEAHEGLDI